MAIDGVKIIDGDLAHDIYNSIIDQYDAGTAFQIISQQFPFPPPDYYQDIEIEIYTTAFALAAWETGNMNESILKEVEEILSRQEGVKFFTEAESYKLGKQRQKELDKFWKKINKLNARPRKPKNYKTVTPVYNINDVLAFQLPDSLFYATVILNIQQYRGACTYFFGTTTSVTQSTPVLEDIIETDLLGRRIPSTHGMDFSAILAMQPEEMIQQGGIDALLKREMEKHKSYVLGMNMMAMDHKDLLKITDRFILIGNLHLISDCQSPASYGGANNFEDLTREFHTPNNHEAYESEKFPIKSLLVK